MNENIQIGTCSRCGVKVVPGALKGLCPRCLLALNLATQTEIQSDDVELAGTRLAPPPAPAPGEIARLLPQFEIIECLGRGGMGAVYKARQPKLDRFVALKILLPERQGDSQFAERFAREARALARLTHPDIVAVYDFGEAGGYHYLVMEYVDGLSLRQLLQRGKLAPDEALGIVPKICEALQFAHQQGVVHRDIKPENILLDKQGQVKIADFGIAKILVPGAQDVSLTGGKDVVGTPHYMAPEQLEHPTQVDHRADIFSLGVVFYEMLTGELPLGKFPPPSRKVQLDVRLDEVVLHALEKEPERRYQHASDVKTAVETIRQTPQAAAAAAATPAADWRRQVAVVGVRDGRRVVHWPGVALVSAVMGSLFLAGGFLFHFLSGEPFPAPHFFPILLVLVSSTLAVAIHRGLHKEPIERLVRLDAHPANQPRLSSAGLATRWTARILGTLWGLVFLMLFIAEGTPPMPGQPWAVQMEFAALALMLAGAVAGWWRDGLASLLMLTGWALFHVAEGHVPLWSLFHLAAAVGVLFGLAWIARQPAVADDVRWNRRLTATVGIIGFPVLFAFALSFNQGTVRNPEPPMTPFAGATNHRSATPAAGSSSRGSGIPSMPQNASADITALRVQQAEREFNRIKELHAQKRISPWEYERARLAHSIAVQEQRGDTNASAVIRLELARVEFRHTSELHDKKLIGESDYQKARTRMDVAAAQFRGDAVGLPDNFGPAIERVIAHDGTNAFFDLDSGQFVQYSGPRTDTGQIRQGRIDLYFSLTLSELDTLSAVGMRCVEIAVGETAWLQPPSAATVGTLLDEASKRGGSGAEAILRPSTLYAFRTREDHAGLLQLLGPTADWSGVRFRYKLVQPVVAQPGAQDQAEAGSANTSDPSGTVPPNR